MTMDKKILLGAMPWNSADIPSMQVAVLKSFLAGHGIEAEAAYWYLEIALALGFEAYTTLAKPLTDAIQSIYSYLCFPEMRSFLMSDSTMRGHAAVVQKKMRYDGDESIRFRWSRSFFSEFEAIHQKILDRYDWNDYALVGFTLNYAQTVPSLYMIRQIKKRNPDCKIIVGGFEASGDLGRSLLENFPEIDFVCNGEGERPLLHLARAILSDASSEEIRQIGGIVSRRADGNVTLNPPEQLENMDEVPTPDFDEYFSVIEGKGLMPQAVVRELPIEASRGCPFSCNFCSVVLQWEGFRSRSPAKVGEDIRLLSQKYKTLNFLFVDNILPKNSKELFKILADHGVEYRFFYEIRAQTPPETLKLMKEAGAVRIQCGVEAFSSSLLRKFNKKSRFIHNLQAMKTCEALGIQVSNNLITDSPFSTQEEVEETVRNMEFCLAYQPVSLSPYALEVGAPDYVNAQEKGLKGIRNSTVYRYFYPASLLERLNLILKDFDSPNGKPDWRPVAKALNHWRKTYAGAKEKLDGGSKSLLEYLEGEDFLLIEDRRGRVDGGSIFYTLDQLQKEVYLLAGEIKPLHAFYEAFPGKQKSIDSLLRYFVENKLMFAEDGQYLSLALPGTSAVSVARRPLRVVSSAFQGAAL